MDFWHDAAAQKRWLRRFALLQAQHQMYGACCGKGGQKGRNQAYSQDGSQLAVQFGIKV